MILLCIVLLMDCAAQQYKCEFCETGLFNKKSVLLDHLTKKHLSAADQRYYKSSILLSNFQICDLYEYGFKFYFNNQSQKFTIYSPAQRYCPKCKCYFRSIKELKDHPCDTNEQKKIAQDYQRAILEIQLRMVKIERRPKEYETDRKRKKKASLLVKHPNYRPLEPVNFEKLGLEYAPKDFFEKWTSDFFKMN